MSFAQEIGLIKDLERVFSRLKRQQRGYFISTKKLSFIQMVIKGGDCLSDIDMLQADPGLLDICEMDAFPGLTHWEILPVSSDGKAFTGWRRW